MFIHFITTIAESNRDSIVDIAMQCAHRKKAMFAGNAKTRSRHENRFDFFPILLVGMEWFVKNEKKTENIETFVSDVM